METPFRIQGPVCEGTKYYALSGYAVLNEYYPPCRGMNVWFILISANWMQFRKPYQLHVYSIFGSY